MQSRRRSQVAVFFLAITLMAAVIPCVPIAICVVDLVSSAFLAEPAVHARSHAQIVSDEQPLALLALVQFRGPPAPGSLV